MRRPDPRTIAPLLCLGLLACEPSATSPYTTEVQDALEALPRAQVATFGPDGLPAFVVGDLGPADKRPDDAADLFPALGRVAPVFRLTGLELNLVSIEHDRRGFTHARYQQTFGALPVVGGELTVHVNPNGGVYAVHGSARGIDSLDPTPTVRGEDAVAAVESARPGDAVGMPRLVAFRHPDTGESHLAWSLVASRELDADSGLPVRDQVFVDAHDGALLAAFPQIHSALNRKVYTAGGGTSLPGSLVRSESSSASSDGAVNDAFENTGTAWQCFKDLFGRDSWNGNGGTLHSTVHYGYRYANAFWDGYRMVYGDGDGYTLGPLAGAYDITVHELSHGITQATSNLVYQNESGALNEAMSDIFAASCEAVRDGAISGNTWGIGEDVYTPRTSGDAMRYMNDPVADGQSYDWYPSRFTGTYDDGGVHLNSGIANLAFKLLVTGGQHPRGRSDVQVPAIGLTKAARIFYRANTSYLTAYADFEDARAATAQAATDLYDAATINAVHAAWSAVGVPGAPPPLPTEPPPPTSGGSTLENGTAITGLSGGAGTELRYTLEVPAGAAGLTIATSGGTGDADLYVKFGSAPTQSSYDQRPYLSGNNETVTVDAPDAGTWHVMVRGYSTFGGVSLTGSFTAPSTGGGSTGGGGGDTGSDGGLTSGTPVTGLSAAKGSSVAATIVVPDGATRLVVEIAGSVGDADLYVRYGAAPTTSTYDARPYLNGSNETATVDSPQAGTWYVMVRAYEAFSSLTLTATVEGGSGTGGSTPPSGPRVEAEPNDSSADAEVIAAPETVVGRIGTDGDQDVFRVEASGAVAVSLTVPAGKDYDLDVYDASGARIGRSANAAGQAESVQVSSSGTVYVVVYGYGSSFDATATYSLGVSF